MKRRLRSYREYINAVKRAGEGKLEKSIAMTYGLGTEDTPMFPKYARSKRSLAVR